MARIVIAAAADADSAAILDYLNVKAGKPPVVKYRALFGRLYDRLADHPDSRAPRPTLGPGIRIGVVSPYIVIYRHVEAADNVTSSALFVVVAGLRGNCSPPSIRAKSIRYGAGTAPWISPALSLPLHRDRAAARW
jgi:toxin ParE1/3/4